VGTSQKLRSKDSLNMMDTLEGGMLNICASTTSVELPRAFREGKLGKEEI
jgi:hypothetical protein